MNVIYFLKAQLIFDVGGTMDGNQISRENLRVTRIEYISK